MAAELTPDKARKLGMPVERFNFLDALKPSRLLAERNLSR
jgi:hypothetical protein